MTSLFNVKLLFNCLLGSHHTDFSHLFLTYVFFRLLEQEVAHKLLVVFLTANVAEQVDRPKSEADQAHGYVVQAET